MNTMTLPGIDIGKHSLHVHFHGNSGDPRFGGALQLVVAKGEEKQQGRLKKSTGNDFLTKREQLL